MRKKSRDFGRESCDREGRVISSGAEGQEIERRRAERLSERLRAMGVNPDEI